MVDNKCLSDSHSVSPSSPELLTVTALITHNHTALPEVYASVYSTQRTTPPEITSRTELSRQAVHTNLDRLAEAGLVSHDASTYHLVEPALPPTVIQSLAELGSRLRLNICATAVDRESVTVRGVRQAIDRSESNTRKILNALTDDGYLTKRESNYDKARLVYRVSEEGTHALESLADPTEFCGRDGTTVTYHATGIEGTTFRTAYEIEDTYFIAQAGSATISDLLAETDKEEKATRNRLDDLVQRGLLSETRRRSRNVYRPTPRTQTMIEQIRACEDDRRLKVWNQHIPEACIERLPDPFLPTHVFDVFSDLLHDPAPDLADEYIQKWKAAGLIDGNRATGFRIIRPSMASD